MPRILAPGVYVEEVSFRAKTIEEASTGITAFVGPTVRGPVGEVSPPFSTEAEFARVYGGTEDLSFGTTRLTNFTAYAVGAFFAEGGRTLHVVRVDPAQTKPSLGERFAAALEALNDVPALSVIAAPGHAAMDACLAPLLIAHVNRPGSRCFALLELPAGSTVAEARAAVGGMRSNSAALYHPWIRTKAAGTGLKTRRTPALLLPPSGYMAGIYARMDRERGVFKPPSNAPLRSASGLEVNLTAAEIDGLTPDGINALRVMPTKEVRVWGARTTASDPEWKYVNVRRYYLFIAQSLERGLEWAVFEPNDEPLWRRVRGGVEDFLQGQWRAGALMGSKPEEAYFVRCDRTTMTGSDLAAGRLVCLVGLAILKPMEFVTLRIGLITASTP